MMRNLTAGEIFDQVYDLKMEAEQRYQIPLSNIVYMGTGDGPQVHNGRNQYQPPIGAGTAQPRRAGDEVHDRRESRLP